LPGKKNETDVGRRLGPPPNKIDEIEQRRCRRGGLGARQHLPPAIS
jgi:hypothetical protein